MPKKDPKYGKPASGPRPKSSFSEITGKVPRPYETAEPTEDSRACYTPDDLEFLRAVDARRRKLGRVQLAYTEILDILKSLGWRKVEPAAREE
jgi:hypothetical protein